MCHTSEQLPCLVFFIEQVFFPILFKYLYRTGFIHRVAWLTIVLKLSKMAVAPLWQDYFKYSFFSGHIVLFELGIWLLERARSHSGPRWVSRWISLSDSSVGWKWGEGGWGSEPGKCLASLCSWPRWVESARLTSVFPICLFKNNQFYSHCLVRFPGEGNDHPLQYSCLEDPMNRGAWRAASMGSQRVGHDGVTNIITFSLLLCDVHNQAPRFLWLGKWIHIPGEVVLPGHLF